jgi:hypothetical protein
MNEAAPLKLGGPDSDRDLRDVRGSRNPHCAIPTLTWRWGTWRPALHINYRGTRHYGELRGLRQRVVISLVYRAQVLIGPPTMVTSQLVSPAARRRGAVRSGGR